MTASPFRDPNVKAALADGRPPAEISLIRCEGCGEFGYYNDGSHFSCNVGSCKWTASGPALDLIIDAGDVITLDDWAERAAMEIDESQR